MFGGHSSQIQQVHNAHQNSCLYFRKVLDEQKGVRLMEAIALLTVHIACTNSRSNRFRSNGLLRDLQPWENVMRPIAVFGDRARELEPQKVVGTK